MVIPQLYELQGRRPVSFKAGAIFVIAQIGSAVTSNFAGLLVTRVLAGAFSAVFSTMVGSVMRELYGTAERNGPMVLFSAASLCGAGLDPWFCRLWFTMCLGGGLLFAALEPWDCGFGVYCLFWMKRVEAVL